MLILADGGGRGWRSKSWSFFVDVINGWPYLMLYSMHYINYAMHISSSGQNLRFCFYTEIYWSQKTHILAHFTQWYLTFNMNNVFPRTYCLYNNAFLLKQSCFEKGKWPNLHSFFKKNNFIRTKALILANNLKTS